MLLSRWKQSTIFLQKVYYRLNINHCILCMEFNPFNICPACKEQLPVLSQGCPTCSEPNDHGHICGACIANPPNFDLSICAFKLKSPVDGIIRRWKDSHRHLGSEILINTLLRKLEPFNYDGILYVPYHWRRLLRRGKHPVLALAQEISKHMGTPLLHCLTRSNHLHTQKGLNRKERLKNLKGAFEFIGSTKDIKGKNLLLVDDVLTTGATCDSIARLLKSKGAKSITVACLAKTQKQH